MATQETTRRDQVKALINGTKTKAEIAAELSINAGSVSSQLTYLRWMGNFILTDPTTKKLSFCTEEEWNAHQAAITAARSAKASTASSKTPEERANALAITIKRQQTQLDGFNKKVAQIEKDLETEPEDAELLELLAEANAYSVITAIKIKRNNALAATLPAPAVVEPAVAGDGDGVDPEDVDPDAEPEDDDLLDD